MYDKAFIINVNKCSKPFFLEQHIDIVNRVTLQAFGRSVHVTASFLIVFFVIACFERPADFLVWLRLFLSYCHVESRVRCGT